eukprot:TRINITY_DN66819_c10_g1_i1.p2 TRINITY_DN66819_c10_g1~~TRINITY_DN66819_c10_g1_i1.p2  ORF type:complete len:144 (-),score=10.83 TRINITY_DN66819_c10_g1_i1:502-933(-)
MGQIASTKLTGVGTGPFSPLKDFKEATVKDHPMLFHPVHSAGTALSNLVCESVAEGAARVVPQLCESAAAGIARELARDHNKKAEFYRKQAEDAAQEWERNLCHFVLLAQKEHGDGWLKDKNQYAAWSQCNRRFGADTHQDCP